MLTIHLPPDLENHLWDVVRKSYGGDLQAAIAAFLQLHDKYGWKEQLLKDVTSIRAEVGRKGGIKEKTIEDAIKRYRKKTGASGG